MIAQLDQGSSVLVWLIRLAILAPFAGGIAIGMLPEHRFRARGFIALLTTGSVATVALVLAWAVNAGATPSVTAWRVSPLLYMGFRVDRLGALFSGTASVLWLATVVYSRGYLGRGPNQRRYFAFMTASLGAAVGVAWAGNLFTLYVFYELLSFSTYPLVVHEGGRAAARSGRTYIAYSLTGASLVLLGITLALVNGGSLEFVPGGLLAGVEVGPGVYGVALCLVAGFGVKAAVMPLHGWLPRAMVAPTPVSGLLHAVAVVKSGVFSIMRALFWVVGSGVLARAGIHAALAWVTGASILLASVVALRQDTLKRRLAYSTIGMLAYITFGAATLTESGLIGGLLHLLMHAVMKITLFLCAGIVISRTGRTRVSELNGIGRVLPWTMGAFAIASAAMVGIPPLAGFVSKWYLMRGALESWGWPAVAVLFASSVLNAAYLFPVVTRAFFKPWDPTLVAVGGHHHGGGHTADGHDDGHGSAAGHATAVETAPAPSGDPAGHGHAHGAPPAAASAPATGGEQRQRRAPEAPWSMLAPVLVLAVLCVVLGLWPAWPLDLIRKLVTESMLVDLVRGLGAGLLGSGVVGGL